MVQNLVPTELGPTSGPVQDRSPKCSVEDFFSMMSYDYCTFSAPVQQHSTAFPPYMAANTHSMEQVPATPAHGYQARYFLGPPTYALTCAPHPPSIVSSYNPYQDNQRQGLGLTPIGADGLCEVGHPMNNPNMDSVTRSSSAKRPLHTPAQLLTRSDSAMSARSKDGNTTFQNGTDIDNFLRVLQARTEDDRDDGSTISGFPLPHDHIDVEGGGLRDSNTAGKTSPKKHRCPHPGCKKKFQQKTHLIIHTRSHTGEKPYAHQNRFHADTVKALAAKFSGMSTAELANLSADDRELCKDFLGTYKNLNKGIKGRGKGRNVAPAISPQGSVQQPTMPMYAQMLHGLLPLPQLAYPSHHGKHHPHPQQLHSPPADRGGFPLDYDMVRHGGEPNYHATHVYGIFDVDHESGVPLSTLGTHYEEGNAQTFPLG